MDSTSSGSALTTAAIVAAVGVLGFLVWKKYKATAVAGTSGATGRTVSPQLNPASNLSGTTPEAAIQSGKINLGLFLGSDIFGHDHAGDPASFAVTYGGVGVKGKI